MSFVLPRSGLEDPGKWVVREMCVPITKPNRLISADEFEEKLCEQTQLSIEDMNTVLRLLYSCQTVRKPDE